MEALLATDIEHAKKRAFDGLVSEGIAKLRTKGTEPTTMYVGEVEMDYLANTVWSCMGSVKDPCGNVMANYMGMNVIEVRLPTYFKIH